MSHKIKNAIIISFLILITIPFVLITDLFPFMRFGMFAEPIQLKIQKELFLVTYVDKSKKEQIFNSKASGIEPHYFNYLARNYFYKNQSEKLIENISNIVRDSTITEWRIKKIVYPIKSEEKPDTIVVFKKSL